MTILHRTSVKRLLVLCAGLIFKVKLTRRLCLPSRERRFSFRIKVKSFQHSRRYYEDDVTILVVARSNQITVPCTDVLPLKQQTFFIFNYKRITRELPTE